MSESSQTAKILRCASHGEVAWEDHVACENCDRVYQTSDTEAPQFAPRVCPCGKRLMPDTRKPHKRFTAVPICPGCFALKVREQVN